jgi:hypothetical protein
MKMEELEYILGSVDDFLDRLRFVGIAGCNEFVDFLGHCSSFLGLILLEITRRGPTVMEVAMAVGA